MVSTELYKWGAATPDDAIVHARAYAATSASATASLHRGLDVSADAHAKAGAVAALGDDGVISASLVAQLQVEASVALQAKLPLDLFAPPGAGLVILFRAGADASASVALTATLELGELIGRLLPKFEGPWAGLVDLIEDEFELSVGLWGRVEGAIEAHGHAILAGYLLASDNPSLQPGFTADIAYSAGVTWGAGGNGVVNVGFLHPDRLVARLGERFATIAADAISKHAATVPEGPGRDAELAAGALARILIPLGLGAAYSIGGATVDAASGTRRAAAVTAIGDQLIHQAQAVVLRALIEYAGKELGRLFNPDVVVDAILLMENPSVVLGPFRDVRKAVTAIAAGDTTEPTQVIAAIEDLLAATEALLETSLFVGARVTTIRRALAVIWSTGQVLQALATFAATPSDVNRAKFNSTRAPLPGASAFAHEIPHAGTAPTLAELIDFLVNQVWDDAVAAIPWLEEVSTWLNQALGVGSGHTLSALFTDLLPPSAAKVDHVVADLSPLITTATRRLREQALAPLTQAAHHDPVLADLINDVIDPLLDAIPLVALAGLSRFDGSDDDQTRVREALAALTFQAVSKFVFDITTELVEDALGQQAQVFARAAADVAANGADSATYHQLSALGIGGVFSVQEAQQLLELCAAALTDTETTLRNTMPLLSTESGAGMADPATRPARLKQLMDDDKPPIGTDLLTDLTIVSNSSSALAREILPPFVMFGEKWLERRIGDIVAEAGQAAHEVVVWVQHRIEELNHDVTELQHDIDRWRALAEHELGLMAGEVANVAQALRAESDAVFADLQARGNSLIDEVVPDLPGWRATAKQILHGVLHDVHGVVDGILAIIEDAASAAEGALNAAASSGQVTSGAVHDHVRSTIYVRSNRNIAVGVTVAGATFPITVTASDVAGSLWNRTSSSAAYNAAVDNAVAHAQAAAQAQAQRANSQAVHDQVVTSAQAISAGAELVPGHDLHITIETPAALSDNPGRARLQVRVRGANRTFVEPTLGVAQRVVIRLNDEVVQFNGAWWWVDQDDLVLAAQLVARPEEQDLVGNHRKGFTSQGVRVDGAHADDQVVHLSRVVASATVVLDDDGTSRLVKQTQYSDQAAVRATSLRPPDQLPDQSPGQSRRSGGESLAGPEEVEYRLGPAALAQSGVTRGAGLRKDGGNIDIVETPQRPKPSIHQTTPVSTTSQPSGGTVVVDWPPTPLWVAPIAQLPVLDVRPGLNTLQVAVFDGDGRTATDSTTFCLSAPDAELRAHIALAAYYRWVARNKAPGNPVDDWLHAEAEVKHTLVAQLAHQYYLDRMQGGGGPAVAAGRALEDWLRAEQAVALRMSAS